MIESRKKPSKPGLIGWCSCVQDNVIYDHRNGLTRDGGYWECRSCGFTYDRLNKIPGKVGLGRLEDPPKEELSQLDEIRERLVHPNPPKMIFFGHYKQDMQHLLEERVRLEEELKLQTEEVEHLREHRRTILDELENVREELEDTKHDLDAMDHDKDLAEEEVDNLEERCIELEREVSEQNEELERLKEYEWMYNDLEN